VRYWELEADSILQLVDGTGNMYVVTDSPPAVWRWRNYVPQKWCDLDLSAVHDACYWQGQVVVAGDELVMVDLDEGEVNYGISIPEATDFTAVASDGTSLYVCVDGTTVCLYRFVYGSLRLLCELPYRVGTCLASNNIVMLGGSNGVVYRYSSSLETVYNTGAEAVTSLFQSGELSVGYAGTSPGALVFRCVSSEWVSDTALGEAGAVTAFALWEEKVVAGTSTSGNLWVYNGDAWVQWYTLEDVVAVRDLVVDTDGALWVAATHTDGARLYRIEVASPGVFSCGVSPPDVLYKVLREV